MRVLGGHSGLGDEGEGWLLRCDWVLHAFICTRGSPLLELGNTQKMDRYCKRML